MPSPNDLTTLADLKAWLGISSTTDDAAMAALITEISVAILSDLGRPAILPIGVTEVRDGGGVRSLVLRHWPVGQLLTLSVDGIAVSPGAGSGASGAALLAVLDVADPAPPGGLQRVSLSCGLFPNGIQNVTLVYRAGYEVSETIAVPAAAPYTVAATAPFGAWGSDGAVSYASGGALQASPSGLPGTYAVKAGVYAFSAGDAGASMTLRYGYVPADLSRACREWAGERYAYRSRIGQSSRSLGGQETAAFVIKAMPDFVSRLLQPYRRVAGP